ncbi:MAG: PfkB family carbohydrate kinase, partial [Candidatus Dormibacteria bacterium]
MLHAADATVDVRIAVFVPLPCLDRYIQVSAQPVAGSKVIGHVAGEWPGGVAANFAVAAALLGARVDAFGWAGSDRTSEICVESLAVEGVAVDLISVHPGIYPYATIILVDPSGERSVIHLPAARPNEPEASWPSELAQRNFDLCYFSSWDTLAVTLARTVKSTGGLVACTLETTAIAAPSFAWAELLLIDLLFLSSEAAVALGWNLESPSILPALWSEGPPVIVITLGAQG